MYRVIIFIGGVAVGSLVTWGLLKEKYIRQTQEEIDEVREYYRQKNQAADMTVDSTGVSESDEKPDLMAYAAKIAKSGYTDYSNYNNTESSEPVILNDPTYKAPYIIPPEEFGLDDEYTMINLNYYVDDILTDDDDQIIENVDEIVGLENLKHMGEYEDDALHIRNENYKCEYEILLSRRSYHDATEVN